MPSDIKDFTEHYCLVIYSQGQWDDRFQGELSSRAKGRFWELSGHHDCQVCNTCPICRSFEELFDPLEPGEYDLVCGICGHLIEYFKERLGQADGLMLFSHHRPIEEDLIRAIFEEDKVKKVFVLHLMTSRVHTFDPEGLAGLERKMVSRSDILAGGVKDNILYEIRRDEYMR